MIWRMQSTGAIASVMASLLRQSKCYLQSSYPVLYKSVFIKLPTEANKSTYFSSTTFHVMASFQHCASDGMYIVLVKTLIDCGACLGNVLGFRGIMHLWLMCVAPKRFRGILSVVPIFCNILPLWSKTLGNQET